MNTAVIRRRDNPMVVVHDLKQRLQQTSSIDEVRDIANAGAAVWKYAKLAKRSRAEQNACAEVTLLARRRISELLDGMEKHKGRPAKASQVKRLFELGIDYNQSHRWRLLTKFTPDDLEQMREDCDRMDRALTMEYVCRQFPREDKPPLPWQTHWMTRPDEEMGLEAINWLHDKLSAFATPAAHEMLDLILRDDGYLHEQDWVCLRDGCLRVLVLVQRGFDASRRRLGDSSIVVPRTLHQKLALTLVRVRAERRSA